MSDIQQGLLIAAIGMGLVFILIIFLWLLMALMMRVTSNEKRMKEKSDAVTETPSLMVPELAETEGQRRAAAAAVAVALAVFSNQARKMKQDSPDQISGLSPWLSYHRARQLENKKTRG
ncbi:MAG: OadG family protein [Chloroflexota bacterium]|nr:OadG family protein [Chloroflexota bacterium]